MRDRFIDAVNGALKEQFDYVPLDASIKIADRLIAEGFGLVSGREADFAPCKVGDSVFVPFFNEENGVVYLDELRVTDVSVRRIWVGGQDGFDFSVDDIGERVFLSLESGEEYYRALGKDVIPGELLSTKDEQAYLQSPERLAERVNMVLLLNVSDEAKKEMLMDMFKVGQEYFEKNTGRSIRLTKKMEPDFWKFDVFDTNGEWMHWTSAFAHRLASDILSGDIIPIALAKEDIVVNDVISDARARQAAQVSQSDTGARCLGENANKFAFGTREGSEAELRDK